MQVTATSLRAVGQRLPRSDGYAKVTGQAQYTGDVSLPGMLYGAIVPSPVAKGRIVSIDKSAALEMPGVKAVVTGRDLIDPHGPIQCQAVTWGPILRDQPILAMEEVRYLGEPVAAVVATNPHTAREAAQRVAVEIEEEPAATDLREAIQPDAPLVTRTHRSFPRESTKPA